MAREGVDARHVRYANRNRNSPPAVLLRESYREGGKVKSRSPTSRDWPEAKIDSLRRVLAGETLLPLAAERFEIARSLAHGHVAAVLGVVRRSARQGLAEGAAVQVDPRHDRGAGDRAGRQAGDGAPGSAEQPLLARRRARLDHDEDELYAALDLFGRGEARVEKVLAQRHLKDGVLAVRTFTSSYLEGRRCELAQFGYSRDHRSDRPQIVFGLLCTQEGCPVAVEVFEGDLGDPSTLASQVGKLRTRFA